MDDQRKEHINPKGPRQRNCSKQLQTHKLPTDHIKNINCTNKGINLLLAQKPQIITWRKERVLQRIQRHSRVILRRSTPAKWEQGQTEISNYVLDWLQKAIWYDSAKLDNKLHQNVQNNTWIWKLYREYHENMERRIDSRRKKLSWSKDPERYI